MKKKTISLMLSILLISSFSVTAKASDTDSLMNSVPVVEEIILPAEEVNTEPAEAGLSETPEVLPNDPTEETTSEVTSIEVEMHPGETIDFQVLLNQHVEKEPIIIDTRSSLVEGELDEVSIGQHEVYVTYKNNDGTESTSTFLVTVTGKPVIQVENSTLLNGEPFTLNSLGLSATDHEDGDLTEMIILKESPVAIDEIPDETIFPEFSVLLSVTDQDGNETLEEVLVTIETNDVTAQAVVVNDLNPEKTITLSGANRFRTATAISQAMYKTADAVILVSANNFPDALSAGPLSRAFQAPILLTNSGSLSSSTEEEIKRLGATKVYILGGEAAVSASVVAQLTANNLQIERIAGSSRYTTAIAAAEIVGFSSTIILANGDEFADAMTAGSYASMNGYPIILSRADRLSASVLKYLEMGVDKILIIGGETAISSGIENELRASGKTVTRIAGSNRFNTSVEMAKYAFAGKTSAVVTNGLDFADALTAVPYAAYLGLPVLLTSKDRINAGITEYLIDNNIANFHFIGGESAISPAVKHSMMYPSLYELTYRSADTSGTWLKESKNGEPTGNLTGNGLSKFEISSSGDKDIRIRYGISLINTGWQGIVDSGPVGATGSKINGLIMELKGADAKDFDVSYRVYIEGSGWTQWTLGGNPLGSPSGKPVLGIEAKIIKGNALVVKYDLFPAKPKEMTYAYTTSALNLRSGEGSSSPLILQMQNKSHLEIISINTSNNWGKVNYTARGITYEGYVLMSYVRKETHVSKAIVTIDGIKNGDPLPTSSIVVKGDAAYNGGVSEINYYINGVKIGKADYGYLSSTSILQGFDAPMKTGYRISIPASQWKAGTINSLKIEVVGKDGRKEWEVRYLNGNSKVKLVFEPYAASFNYYLDTEHAKKAAVYGSGIATKDQISAYLDPTTWITHETYRYMFLDLGYSKDDYTVTVEQMDSILKGKGILSGTGSTFLQGAIDFNINPFYLIAHAILETGHGTSVLANGQQIEHYHEDFGTLSSALIPLKEEDKLKKWYNVYGIGAYDGNANLWGAERAYHQRWDTIEKAIHGGAGWIASGYINRVPEPQNSNYKMRYNFKETMSHQYATDVMWAYKQASNIKRQFDGMGFEAPLKFIIPTFGDIRP